MNIFAPVWFDGNGQFLNDQQLAVNSDSIVVGTVLKPAGYSTPPYPNPTQVSTLEVKDPNLGVLYLSWTLLQWQTAVNTAANPGSGGGTGVNAITKQYNIASPSLTIIDGVLSGVTINLVFLNGIQVDSSQWSFAGDTITFASTLNALDIVTVQYYPG